MIPRFLTPSNNYSFFLFGPRGSGKSMLLKALYGDSRALWIDLLIPEEEAIFQTNPSELINRTLHLPQNSRIIIDEVQKAPKLLNLVQKLIEEKRLLFAMSGSSARKLKAGAANLLGGRAFVYYLYPFSFLEIENDFCLDDALKMGLLPKLREFNNPQDKVLFLRAYANMYLREEIQMEQIIRNLPTFRRFLETSAQMNGEPTNFSKIARDIYTDHSVVRNYYEILEDTMVGFSLPVFEISIRKQMKKKPKFYFFDMGIKRALDKTLEIPLKPNTYEYGKAFEHFIILEFFKLCHYRQKDESLYYMRTKSGLEVDLIIERPGKTTLLIEIKSSNRVNKEDTKSLFEISKEMKHSQSFLISQDLNEKTFSEIKAYHWRTFFNLFFQNEI